MKHILEPRSIALVGASEEFGKVGGIVTRNLINSDYQGEVYLVNPNRETIFGKKAYPSLDKIPGEIELVEILIPAKYVPGVVKQAAEKGVKGAIIVSSGFAEVGNKQLQDDVVDIAKRGGMRIIGPNCFGLINTGIDLDLTFTFTKALKGEIAFVSQSGAMCCGTLDWASENYVGYSKFINLGNKCDVDEVDILIYLDRDEETKMIALYIEGFKDGRKFLEVARKVAENKPIIVIKPGTTDVGAMAALSHTGSIAGHDKIIEAAFKQSGIIRLEDVEELLDASIALSSQPLPRGNRAAILSNAGGLAVMMADWCINLGLKVPAFSEDVVERLKEILPPIASPRNPIDMSGGADYNTYKEVLDTVSKEEGIDIIIPVFVAQGLITSEGPAKAVAEYSERMEKPTIAFWMGGTSIRDGVAILRDHRVPVYSSSARAAKAAVILWKYQAIRKKFERERS